MIKICYRSGLLTALVFLSLTTAQGGTTAQTDLASITVTPLSPQAGAKADWQTIYDYAGGAVLPPGTRITTNGKWIDPPVRQDQTGVTFSFPDLPNNPENSQFLKCGFWFDRPIANYPTRTTVQYTSFFDQAIGQWSPFNILTSDDEVASLFGNLTSLSVGVQSGSKPAGKSLLAKAAASPLKLVGDNTLVFTLGGESPISITMNGKDATDLFLERSASHVKRLQPSAMLVGKLAFYNHMSQFPHNKGDWFAVRAFKIEQMRPPLEASSEAAIDLTVPGSESVQVTIEVVDAWNDSKGYVLRDAPVSPGKYRLYWDGIDQKQIKPEDTAWIGAGSYTFRLTTSKTAVHYAGEMNPVPKYTTKSYDITNATALAITPPGTTPQTAQLHKWTAENNPDDTRKFDATDSVQFLGVRYDASHAVWIAADGAVINTRCGDYNMEAGRGLAITPPDPSDPTNPTKQFYFASQSFYGGRAVVSCSLPLEAGSPGPPQPKTLTSPDWNRTKPGFVPYRIEIGKLPSMLGAQHELFFRTGTAPTSTGSGLGAKKIPEDQRQLQAEWMFRNVRLYEEGSPDPGPTTFDPSKFTVRPANLGKNQSTAATTPLTTISETTPPVPAKKTLKPKPPTPIPAGTVMVEDNGHAVHLKNAPTVNYPLNYTITPHTILAFDLDVIDHSKVGSGNGIGLSPDVTSTKEDEISHYFEFMGGHASNDPRFGFNDPSIGAYSYPTYKPNTLYTDSIPLSVARGTQAKTFETNFLFEPGFYGVKISEDGKLLFACNNADNRLEVRDISTDGSAVAKIPIDYPMFVTLAPEGAAGAAPGTRYVYVDSPKAGLLRIAWNLSDNIFGKPETLTPASEFAYPRGIVYNAVAGRIFVCDAYPMDRSKVANQIAVIDPNSGKVLTRFGKPGGVNPATGGAIDDETFTCPLTIDADSKGGIWVNDYYSCQVRKYDFDPTSNGFKLERSLFGSNAGSTSAFFWLPGAPPTEVWTMADFFVRDDADFDVEGRLTNQRITAASQLLTDQPGRSYPHFSKVGDHIYATFHNTNNVYEQTGNGWTLRFAFGGTGVTGTTTGLESIATIARDAGLLANPGEPPTDLDKAIAASGDPDWQTRPWTWSDLNGDGKMEYSADNPELKIDFNAKFSLDGMFPSTCFRSSDGAYVCPYNDKKGGTNALLVLLPQTVNGKVFYDWKNAQIIPCTQGEPIADVLAQDGRYYVLRSTRGWGNSYALECYDESGKLLWTREHNNNGPLNLQSLGDGMVTVMDRSWNVDGPVMIRNKDGDLVNQVLCRDNADCWSSGALRVDADTGYIGLVQFYKVTGLSTVKSAAATVTLSRAGL